MNSTFGRGCDCCKKLCADKDSSEPSINNVDNKIIMEEQIIKYNEKNVEERKEDVVETLLHNPGNNKTHVKEELIQENEKNVEGWGKDEEILFNDSASIRIGSDFLDNIIENSNNDEFFKENEKIISINNNDSPPGNNFPGNISRNNAGSNLVQLIPQHNDIDEQNKGKEKTTLFLTKIDKAGKDECIKKCFNKTWYNACKDSVLLLKEAEDYDTDVLEVTGSGNNWEITDTKGDVLGGAGCNPDSNKWIIVEFHTLNKKLGGVGDSFIFYVDDITSFVGVGVFENIKCYSIGIIAANTSAVKSMIGMFYQVKSALEQDKGEKTAPGLIGLDKLNVENVKVISAMFFSAIHKQATLDQLKKWRFSGGKDVLISGLFFSQVEGLDFTILNGWSSATCDGTVSFRRSHLKTSKQVFVKSNNKEDFKPPIWYDNIKELE